MEKQICGGVIMAEKFRFFDSTEDDFRVYRAAEYAAYFDALVKTGVFSDSLDALQVTADGTSLNTTVSAGKAFLLGYMYENDSPLQLAHDTPDPTLDRIDRVVIRLDLNQRTIKATIIKGTPSATPEVPQLVQDVAGQIYDVSLAQVTIKAGQSTIAQNQVVDDREYARYTAKPAWYPQGQIPMDAWIYTHFPNQLTAEEKEEIEANTSLMEIVNAPGTLWTHLAENSKDAHIPQNVGIEKVNYTALEQPTKNDDESNGYGRGSIWIHNFEHDGVAYICLDATVGNAKWIKYADTRDLFMFYYLGDENNPITGGWGTGYVQGTGTINKNASDIYFAVSSTGSSDAERTLVTTNKVDLSDIKELRVEVSNLVRSGPEGSPSFVINVSNDKYTSSYVSIASAGVISSGTAIFDVANLSGEYYIKLTARIGSASGSISFNIKRVWGVKR